MWLLIQNYVDFEKSTSLYNFIKRIKQVLRSKYMSLVQMNTRLAFNVVGTYTLKMFCIKKCTANFDYYI